GTHMPTLHRISSAHLAECNIGAGEDDAQSGIDLPLASTYPARPNWPRRVGAGDARSKRRVLTSDRMISGPDHVPAGFFTGAFCALAGGGGGAGARSMKTRRPLVKR